MAKEDWKTVKLPVLMLDALDKIVQTEKAKKNGIFSNRELIVRVMSDWLSQYEKDFGITVPRNTKRTIRGDDVMEPFD